MRGTSVETSEAGRTKAGDIVVIKVIQVNSGSMTVGAAGIIVDDVVIHVGYRSMGSGGLGGRCGRMGMIKDIGKRSIGGTSDRVGDRGDTRLGHVRGVIGSRGGGTRRDGLFLTRGGTKDEDVGTQKAVGIIRNGGGVHKLGTGEGTKSGSI